MIDTTGKIVGVSRCFDTDELILQIKVGSHVGHLLDRLNDKLLDIKIKVWRDKRSLNANAFAWVLMQDIAEAIDSDKWSVYLEMLKRYSRAFTHVIVPPEAVERVKREWRTTEDVGMISVNGQSGFQLRCYYGSSQFDTKEMSVFIDGLVREAQELGIDTRTPDEGERMKQQWDV